MKKIPFLLFLLLLVILTGCYSVEPLEEPVVSLYPTTQPMTILKKLTPVRMTEGAIQEFLEEAQWLFLLKQADMSDNVYALIRRGLATRGYCEIDCRKANCVIDWITLANFTNGKFQAKARFNTTPPELCCHGLLLDREMARHIYRPTGQNEIWHHLLQWEAVLPSGKNFIIQHHDGIPRGTPAQWDVIFEYSL